MSKDDLVSRLRAWAEVVEIPSGKFVNEDITFAADRITALEAEVGRLNSSSEETTTLAGKTVAAANDAIEALSAKLKLAEAALEPFAKAAGYYAPEGYGDEQFVVNVSTVTREGDKVEAVLRRGDYRRAISALHSIRED